MMDAAVIDGYLDKLGRNGKWQTRWFETDGECLTYYKSSKRIKLMATLDLAKVGSIVINDTDPTGCCFTINISERPYHLRAESKAACRDWVITLNRVKEARMQQGNVKLVAANHPPDLLDEHYTPRVVVVANRQRTRAVDDDDIHSWEGGGGAGFETSWSNNHAEGGNHFDTAMTPAYSNRLARWQKPRTSLSRLASKLFKWARSLRKYNCTTDVEHHVVLDHHVHPPGHDDKRKVGFHEFGSVPNLDISCCSSKPIRFATFFSMYSSALQRLKMIMYQPTAVKCQTIPTLKILFPIPFNLTNKSMTTTKNLDGSHRRVVVINNNVSTCPLFRHYILSGSTILIYPNRRASCL